MPEDLVRRVVVSNGRRPAEHVLERSVPQPDLERRIETGVARGLRPAGPHASAEPLVPVDRVVEAAARPQVGRGVELKMVVGVDQPGQNRMPREVELDGVPVRPRFR